MIPAGEVCRGNRPFWQNSGANCRGLAPQLPRGRLKFQGECGNIVQNYVRRRTIVMKSKNRALLLVFLLAVILILGALGVLWYYTAHMDRSGWVQQNGYY